MSAVATSYTRGEIFGALSASKGLSSSATHIARHLVRPEIKQELYAFYRDAREHEAIHDLKNYARVDGLAESLQSGHPTFQQHRYSQPRVLPNA